jgi:hypothetical protein
MRCSKSFTCSGSFNQSVGNCIAVSSSWGLEGRRSQVTGQGSKVGESEAAYSRAPSGGWRRDLRPVTCGFRRGGVRPAPTSCLPLSLAPISTVVGRTARPRSPHRGPVGSVLAPRRLGSGARRPLSRASGSGRARRAGRRPGRRRRAS